MWFRVLGPLEIHHPGGGRTTVDRPKQRQVLVTLLLEANREVSLERLAENLWEDRRPRSAVGMIRTYVFQLRRLLAREDTSRLLRTGNRGYRIEISPEELDFRVFLDLAARGRDALARGDAAEAGRLLGRALDQWRGEALEDVPLSHGLGVPAAWLEDERLTAFEDWVDARLLVDRHRDLLLVLRGTIDRHPLRERLWEQLMVILYRAGRTAEALEAFQRLRGRLAADLGLDPGPAARNLRQAIIAEDPRLRTREVRAVLTGSR